MTAISRQHVYSALSLIGLAFVFYSIASKKYFLTVISSLFTAVSAYNIFCGMKRGN